MLVPAAHAAVGDAEQMLHRSSAEGTLPTARLAAHRFGTPARAVDVTAAAIILVVRQRRARGLARARLRDGDRGDARAQMAALVRLRRTRPAAQPFPAPFNLRSAAASCRSACWRLGLSSPPARRRCWPRRCAGYPTAASLPARACCSPVGRSEPPIAADERTRSISCRPRALARPDRRPPGQCPRAGSQSARARPCRGRAADAARSRVVVMTVRLLGVDVARGARQRPRRRQPSGAAVGRRRARRAARPPGAPADRAGAQRRSTRSSPRSSACARPTSTSASRRRCRPTIRRGCSARPGSAADRPNRSTSGSSSITAADAPTPITSARIRRSLTPAISI